MLSLIPRSLAKKLYKNASSNGRVTRDGAGRLGHTTSLSRFFSKNWRTMIPSSLSVIADIGNESTLEY